PNTRVRIAGPIGEDFATCSVKTEKDGRLKIYPRDLMAKMVSRTLDSEFWEHEVGQYEKGTVLDFYPMTGSRDHVDAITAKVSFVQDNGTEKMDMSGTMVGTIYGDTRYVVSCSSRQEAFRLYDPIFVKITRSVVLAEKYHPFATGYYRNFTA